ncbi:hypothetical protein ACFL2U_00185 [Patescibacteria group bacterium]
MATRALNWISGGMIDDVRILQQWEDLSKLFISNIFMHDMNVAMVSGVGSVYLYGPMEEEALLNCHARLPEREEPRMKIVLGPVVNVSETTHRSLLIELFLKGMADLYFSEIVQPYHFRINGYYTQQKVIDRDAPSSVFVEGNHHPDEMPSKRLVNSHTLVTSMDDQSREMIYWLDEFHRICQEECVKMQTPEDITQHFICLNSDEIAALWQDLRETGQLNNPPISKELIINNLKIMGIVPSRYITV